LKWAKRTFPIWLYVSVTGVVIYWMLYQMSWTTHGHKLHESRWSMWTSDRRLIRLRVLTRNQWWCQILKIQ
jgi:hypothetical protein